MRQLLEQHTALVAVLDALLPGAVDLPSSATATVGDAHSVLFWSTLSIVRESHALYAVIKHLATKIAGAQHHAPNALAGCG
jgi:hypothetical protein